MIGQSVRHASCSALSTPLISSFVFSDDYYYACTELKALVFAAGTNTKQMIYLIYITILSSSEPIEHVTSSLHLFNCGLEARLQHMTIKVMAQPMFSRSLHPQLYQSFCRRSTVVPIKTVKFSVSALCFRDTRHWSSSTKPSKTHPQRAQIRPR